MVLKKRALTLIEMMVVMALIALVSGVVAVNVRGLLHDQRFRTETAQILDTLRLAQDLMLIANSDAHVIFSKDSVGRLNYLMQLEKPLNKGWTKEIMRPRAPLTAIRSIEFQDTTSGHKTIDAVTLSFLSGGSVMSGGTLRLADTDRNALLQSSICLPGYPAPLGDSALCESTPKLRQFIDKITLSTQQAIQEKDLDGAHK